MTPLLVENRWLPFPIGRGCSQVWCRSYLTAYFGFFELRTFPLSLSKVQVNTFYPLTFKVGSKCTWIILTSSGVKPVLSQLEMEIEGLFERPAVDERFGLSLRSTNRRRRRRMQVTKAIIVPIISLWKSKLQSILFFNWKLESKKTKLHKCYQQMSYNWTQLIRF